MEPAQFNAEPLEGASSFTTNDIETTPIQNENRSTKNDTQTNIPPPPPPPMQTNIPPPPPMQTNIPPPPPPMFIPNMQPLAKLIITKEPLVVAESKIQKLNVESGVITADAITTQRLKLKSSTAVNSKQKPIKSDPVTLLSEITAFNSDNLKRARERNLRPKPIVLTSFDISLSKIAAVNRLQTGSDDSSSELDTTDWED